MRMMLVGAGAVGESILKVMQWRDPKGEWLEYVLVCDYDLKRAEEVVTMMKGDTRFEASKIDATNTEEMAEMIREHKIDFVMDAAPPFASNMILTLRLKQVQTTEVWEPGLFRWNILRMVSESRTAIQNQ